MFLQNRGKTSLSCIDKDTNKLPEEEEGDRVNKEEERWRKMTSRLTRILARSGNYTVNVNYVQNKIYIRDIQVNEVTCHTILIKNVDNTKGFGRREIILYLLPYDDTVSIILATYKACKGMELCGMTLQDVRTPVKPWPHHHLRQSSRLVLHNVHCPNQQQSIDEEKNKLVREEEVP